MTSILALLLGWERYKADVLNLEAYVNAKSNTTTLKRKFQTSSQHKVTRIRSTKPCARNSTRSRRSWKTFSRRSAISERLEYST